MKGEIPSRTLVERDYKRGEVQASAMTDEVFLNGIVEDETDRYYHICFLGAADASRDNPDNYVFVPKVVCRIAGPRTVAIQEWYVTKHKLARFLPQASQEKPQVDMDKIRLQQAIRAMRRAKGKQA